MTRSLARATAAVGARPGRGRLPRLAAALARSGITVALLWWIWSRVEPGELIRRLATVDGRLLAVAWATTVLSYWSGSVKLRMVLRQLRCTVPTATIFRSSAVTGLYSMALPGPLSSGVKWMILRRASGDGAAVTAAMACNQLQMLTAAVVIGALAMPIAGGPRILFAVWAVAVGALLLIGLWPFVVGRRIDGRLSDRWLRSLTKVRDRIMLFRSCGASFHVATMALTVGTIMLGGVGLFMIAALAVGAQVSVFVAAWLWAVVFLLGRIPISIANLGVREATIVSGLAVHGVATETALLMSLVVLTSALVIAALGAGFVLFRIDERTRCSTA